MRVPVPWLLEYCDPGLPAAAGDDRPTLEERLTMTGTKVEAVHHHGVRALEHFVVGRVLEAERHPDADRLSVCRVALGAEEAQIVCGAPNVAAGQTVAVAAPGAIMADGTRLGRARLRGVESAGMILAEDELALGLDHAGILVLEERVAPGTPLAEVLPIAAEVLELEITPNRPDCLGVYGVARELHAATGAPLAAPPWNEDPGSDGPVSGIEVAVACPDLCPRFTARVFEDVTMGPSPLWLKARLMAAGQRPINNVVDITNYVMLLTGQPLHAFDLDRVEGLRLTVRRARDGEPVQTLDGQQRTLDAEMVLIEDAQGPTSIAGVMGGARSEVSETTTRVLMEVANWHGPNIHRTSWTLGLRSEASGRFEKGLAPEQAMEAQAVAAQLMIALCGARLAPGTIDIGGPGPAPVALHLREARVEALLGAAITRDRQGEILRALEFDTEEAPDGLDVRVPAFRRNDVTREVDLVEEVCRIDGVDRLPATLPRRRPGAALTREQRLRRRAADTLVARGLFEIVGWSFIGAELLDRLRLPAGHADRDAVAVSNPLSEDQALLRTSLLGSLLDAARHNAARGTSDLRLFEVGAVYHATGEELPAQQRALGALLHGRLAPASWRPPGPAPADYFSAKGLLEALGQTLRAPALRLEPEPQPFLHPGRSARVSAGGRAIGWIGELHPLVASAWDLDATAMFQVDLDGLIDSVPRELRYEDLISYPALRQDIAVVVDEAAPAAEVIAVVRRAAGELLDGARVFDVYRGAQVGEGRKSLALALSLRAADRTLTDAEAAVVRERITAALARELGGTLRA